MIVIWRKNNEEVKEDYDINGELLEVGCGPIPSLAKSIKKEQKHGSITVMNPIIKIKDYGSLKIINKKRGKNMYSVNSLSKAKP